MDKSFFKRSVNEGFSGGEKKRNEILQMAVLEPKLAVLDETDSGLDIDALRIVAEGVNKLRDENKAIILVTHYQRLLNYITPDFVHVLANGKIVKEGGKELALELEEKGYDWVKAAIEIGSLATNKHEISLCLNKQREQIVGTTESFGPDERKEKNFKKNEFTTGKETIYKKNFQRVWKMRISRIG